MYVCSFSSPPNVCISVVRTHALVKGHKLGWLLQQQCPVYPYLTWLLFVLAQEKQLRECKPDKKADGSYSLQCCQMKELLMTLSKHLLAYCFMTSSNDEPVNFPVVCS